MSSYYRDATGLLDRTHTHHTGDNCGRPLCGQHIRDCVHLADWPMNVTCPACRAAIDKGSTGLNVQANIRYLHGRGVLPGAAKIAPRTQPMLYRRALWAHATHLSITEGDIRKGRTHDCGYCPIARSARRTFLVAFDEQIKVTAGTLLLGRPGKPVGGQIGLGTAYLHRIPEEATRFIRAFDRGKPVQPFDFWTRPIG